MTTARAALRRLRLVIPIAIFVSAGAAISAAQPTFATKRLINTVINGLLPFDVRREGDKAILDVTVPRLDVSTILVVE